MNPFFISFVALCIAQGAVANYQSAGYGNQGANYNQRKIQYGAQSGGYQQAAAPAYQQSSYEGNSHEQSSYAAPSSASVSSYDKRAPVASASYGTAAGPSYGRQQSSYGQQSAYGQQQSYGKAAKYEEPNYPPQPFAWGYDINDGYGGAQYHKESGDEYGKRTGSYGYTDAYGVYRQVDYVADEHGFRATIKTNEPGTANESPADVELHAYEPPSNYYAGSTNNYGSQQSYGKQAASYAAPAQQSYSAPAYQQQQQQQEAYSRPASYNQQRSSYKAPQVGGYARQSAGYNSEPAGQYSSSAIVPVYQKAAVSRKKY